MEKKLRLNWLGSSKGYEVVAYQGRELRPLNVSYTNKIDADPKKLAQVLMDLEIVAGFPIDKAIKIYLERRENKDWLGY